LPTRLKADKGFRFKTEMGEIRSSPGQIYTVTGEGEDIVEAAKDTVIKLVNFCNFNNYNVYEIKWDWVETEITDGLGQNADKDSTGGS